MLKTFPAVRRKPRIQGLLAREAKLDKHGIEPLGPLLPPKIKKIRRRKKDARPA